MLLSTWQKIYKPHSDLIVQASCKDGSDSWQEHPIGMSWQYVLNYKKGKSLQIGNHENLLLLSLRTSTDQNRRPNGINRKTIAETLSKNGFSTSMIHHETYFNNLPLFKFVVSPEGNGIDCHRHYEALLAGCIPIMEKNPLTEEKYKGCPVLWTTDYSEITTEYLEKIYDEMINKEYDFSCLFMSYYNLELQKQIRECGNYWIQRTTQTLWYREPYMNIVYAFIGPLPSYCVETVHQTRLFYDGPIYFIINDLSSIYIPILEKYNVIIILYDSVVDNDFNSLVAVAYNKFCIVNNLIGREKLFIHSFERFYLLHNLMIQKNISDIFFIELDNLIYDSPYKWLDSFSTKDMAYMFDNYNRSSSGIAYIKNTVILNDFMKFSNDFILNNNGFIDEMTSLYKFWENNKDRVQLLPIHWNDSKYPTQTYETFDLYNSVFDALSIGIFLNGADPYHTNITKIYKEGIGNKSIWGLVDYTVYTYKWEDDRCGRKIPYILNGSDWIRINNLHIHSKNLSISLSKPI